MKIQDLTELFIKQVIECDNVTSYEAGFPALFDHYYQYWSPKEAYSKSLTPDMVRQGAQRVRSRLPIIQERFACHQLNVNDLEVVLFVGHKTSNGHAFEHEGRFVTWLPVEAYPSELAVDVFVAHELAHALHYRSVPHFYFHNRHEKNLLSRQLVTEGLATLVSMQIAGVDEITALWADYISPDKAEMWLDQCKRNKQALAHFALHHYNASIDDNTFFTLYDETDIFKNRAGYYVGLQSVRDVQKEYKIGLQTLLCLGRKEFESLVEERLSRELPGNNSPQSTRLARC